MPAPIALFVYNRPDHTRQTVEALQRNALAAQSDLFVHSDAPKNEGAAASVSQVRDYIRSIEGFKSVSLIELEQNWGVDPSIIDGVTTLCKKFGRVIVLEDDLIVSPWFLKYMNDALSLYEHNRSVMQISGFMFPVKGHAERASSFLPFTTSWGWATWERAWKSFDPLARGYDELSSNPDLRVRFNLNGAYDFFAMLEEFKHGSLDAWDIRWYLSSFMLGGLTLYPHKSLVTNIGFDGTGTHCESSDFADTALSKESVLHFPLAIENQKLTRSVESSLREKRDGKLKSMIKRLLQRSSRRQSTA